MSSLVLSSDSSNVMGMNMGNPRMSNVNGPSSSSNIQSMSSNTGGFVTSSSVISSPPLAQALQRSTAFARRTALLFTNKYYSDYSSMNIDALVNMYGEDSAVSLTFPLSSVLSKQKRGSKLGRRGNRRIKPPVAADGSENVAIIVDEEEEEEDDAEENYTDEINGYRGDAKAMLDNVSYYHGRSEIREYHLRLLSEFGQCKVHVRHLDVVPVGFGNNNGGSSSSNGGINGGNSFNNNNTNNNNNFGKDNNNGYRGVAITCSGHHFGRLRRRVFSQTFVLMPTMYRDTDNAYYIAGESLRFLTDEIELVPENVALISLNDFSALELQQQHQIQRLQQEPEVIAVLADLEPTYVPYSPEAGAISKALLAQYGVFEIDRGSNNENFGKNNKNTVGGGVLNKNRIEVAGINEMDRIGDNNNNVEYFNQGSDEMIGHQQQQRQQQQQHHQQGRLMNDNNNIDNINFNNNNNNFGYNNGNSDNNDNLKGFSVDDEFNTGKGTFSVSGGSNKEEVVMSVVKSEAEGQNELQQNQQQHFDNNYGNEMSRRNNRFNNNNRRGGYNKMQRNDNNNFNQKQPNQQKDTPVDNNNENLLDNDNNNNNNNNGKSNNFNTYNNNFNNFNNQRNTNFNNRRGNQSLRNQNVNEINITDTNRNNANSNNDGRNQKWDQRQQQRRMPQQQQQGFQNQNQQQHQQQKQMSDPQNLQVQNQRTQQRQQQNANQKKPIPSAAGRGGEGKEKRLTSKIFIHDVPKDYDIMNITKACSASFGEVIGTSWVEMDVDSNNIAGVNRKCVVEFADTKSAGAAGRINTFKVEENVFKTSFCYDRNNNNNNNRKPFVA